LTIQQLAACALELSRVTMESDANPPLIVPAIVEIPQRRRAAGIEAFDGDEPSVVAAPAERTGEIAREALECPAGICMRCERVHERRFQIRAGLEALGIDQALIHVPNAEPARLMRRQQGIERGAAFHHRAPSVPCGMPDV
jgi:hypothetical protein